MTVVADVSITPLGEGPSVGRFVRLAVEELRKSGIKVELGAMSTTLEAKSSKEIFEAVERAKERMFEAGVKRVYVVLRLDERRDKDISIESKKRAILS
jgi:uncharacterized protein (TIGR00106 family)